MQLTNQILAIVTIALTFIFFILALLSKGLTHDIFVEAGVFLVSLKVILGMVQIHKLTKTTEEKLDTLLSYYKKEEEGDPHS